MLNNIFCFLNIGFGEFLIIAIALIIVVGPEKIPKVAKKIGKLLAEAKKITSDVQNELDFDEKSFYVEPDNDFINEKIMKNKAKEK